MIIKVDSMKVDFELKNLKIGWKIGLVYSYKLNVRGFLNEAKVTVTISFDVNFILKLIFWIVFSWFNP